MASKLDELSPDQAGIVISQSDPQTQLQGLRNVARLFQIPPQKIENSTNFLLPISKLEAHAVYSLSENKDEGRCRSLPANGA
jgi:hypothetical protein